MSQSVETPFLESIIVRVIMPDGRSVLLPGERMLSFSDTARGTYRIEIRVTSTDDLIEWASSPKPISDSVEVEWQQAL